MPSDRFNSMASMLIEVGVVQNRGIAESSAYTILIANSGRIKKKNRKVMVANTTRSGVPIMCVPRCRKAEHGSDITPC